MNRRFRSGIVLASALAIATAGCAADSSTDAPTTTIQVTGTDALTFDPEAFTVPAGQQISFELTAEAAVEHDVVIGGAADHGAAGDAGHGGHAADGHAAAGNDLHVAHADAGATTQASFSIDAPGTYEIYCSVPGHRQAGMTATLTVVAS